MNITGSTTLTADRATVWRALNDPAVLVATIPGCRKLEAVGDGTYRMTVSAGVGSVQGVYDGEVRLSDHEEPSSFRMHAQGSGAPGTIGADVSVRLEDHPDRGTVLSYDAEAIVGGMIGGVGQRMLAGTSKKMADEFFRNVDALLLTGPGATPGEPAPEAAVGAPQPAAGVAPGTVFTAPPRPPRTGPGFAAGVALGAAAALLGAVVGGWIAGRRR